jgi:hypothetical protein
MKNHQAFISSILTALLLTATAYANEPLDCNRGGSLAKTVAHANPGDTILFTGNCLGPINITQSGLTLQGQGVATIDGQKQTAITVSSVQNVKLLALEVMNGLNGILVNSQAQITMNNITSHDNTVFGIALQNLSSATLKDVKAHHNGVSGLDVENSSAATLSGSFTTEDNFVFGINVNAGSSLTISRSQVLAQRNLLGIQLGTAASGFLAESVSSITVQNNVSTGLTVVSGSHLVSFGGKISAHDNGRNGVSVNSKAGLDLDAASILESFKNGGDGVHMAENSVMTLFNTTGFSQIPGNTTLNTHNNAGNGIAVLTGSNFTLVNQVILEDHNNTGEGVLADNGSSITLLNANITGNNIHDVSLSFGSRSDIRSSTVGSIVCDSNILSRGDIVCTPTP